MNFSSTSKHEVYSALKSHEKLNVSPGSLRIQLFFSESNPNWLIWWHVHYPISQRLINLVQCDEIRVLFFPQFIGNNTHIFRYKSRWQWCSPKYEYSVFWINRTMSISSIRLSDCSEWTRRSTCRRCDYRSVGPSGPTSVEINVKTNRGKTVTSPEHLLFPSSLTYTVSVRCLRTPTDNSGWTTVGLIACSPESFRKRRRLYVTSCRFVCTQRQKTMWQLRNEGSWGKHSLKVCFRVQRLSLTWRDVPCRVEDLKGRPANAVVEVSLYEYNQLSCLLSFNNMSVNSSLFELHS